MPQSNTVEYYQMCRDHMKPGGSTSLWFPLNQGNLDSTKSVIATFFKAFPNGILWSNEHDGHGYDAVLFGQVQPTVIDVDKLQQRLERPDHQAVRQSLHDVGFGEIKSGIAGVELIPDEVLDLLTTYSGQWCLLKDWCGECRLTPTAISACNTWPACG